MKRPGHITLIIIIIVGVSTLLVATYLLIAGVSSGENSLSTQRSAQAKAAADSCAELALSAIQATPASPTLNGSSTLDSTSSEACSYVISGSNPAYTIVATGTSGASSPVTRKVTIVLSQTVPSVVVASWLESS